MLLGESDVIVSYICQRLGWQLPWPKPIAAVVGEDDDATAKVRVEPEEHKTDAKLPAGIELLEPQRLGERCVNEGVYATSLNAHTSRWVNFSAIYGSFLGRRLISQ